MNYVNFVFHFKQEVYLNKTLDLKGNYLGFISFRAVYPS